MSNKVTEDEVIKHVQKYGRYFPALKNTPYTVDWCGKGYAADDTRKLVVDICKAEGINIKR